MDLSRSEEKSFVDIPSSKPAIGLALPAVGICKRPTQVLCRDPFGSSLVVLYSQITSETFLPAEQRGLHMSRIEECLDELREVGLNHQQLAWELAHLISKSQGRGMDGTESYPRTKLELSSSYERQVINEASQRSSGQLLQIMSAAEVGKRSENISLGVIVPFINACPCTQRWAMRDYAKFLRGKGLAEEDVLELVEKAPRQAHTNRGEAKLVLSGERAALQEVGHQKIYQTLERALPIICEKLKGVDEHALVSRAHREGQFCEDNTRALAQQVARDFCLLPPTTLVEIRVEVDESVHFHNLWTELRLTLGQLIQLLAASPLE